MPNEENLKPIQSTEEARERCRVGIAFGAASRRTRSLKEAAERLTVK